MLQSVKDIGTALVNIAVKVYGSMYDFDRDVEDKK